MFSSKKALSPLIAAVLLIVVVVGIGAVVTGIVRDMISQNKETVEGKSGEMSCSRDVIIGVLKIDGEPQICRGSNYVYAVVDNTGAQIDDFQLVVAGTDGIVRNESIHSGSAITQGATVELNGSFDAGAVGTVVQVKFVPKLKKKGQSGYNFCNDVALTYEGVEACI